MVSSLLSHDIWTVLAVLSPFLLPGALKLAGRSLVALSSRNDTSKQQQQQWLNATRGAQVQNLRHGLKWYTLWARNTLTILLVTYALARLAFFRPFNIFDSLGAIPLTIQHSKLSSLLQWHNLSEKHGHIIPYLTSLVARFLYCQFGEATFIGCQEVCDPSRPSDYLAYHTPSLVRCYTVFAVLIALANPRWKVWTGIAVALGCATELYMLAASDMKALQNGHIEHILSLRLYVYRHLGLLILSVLNYWLPSHDKPTQVPQETLPLLNLIQTISRQQDMLQSRIRALETVRKLSVYETSQNGTLENRGRPSAFNTAQKEELRRWLSSITFTANPQARKPASPTSLTAEVTAKDDFPPTKVPAGLSISVEGASSSIEKQDSSPKAIWEPPSPAPSSPASTVSNSSHIETPTPSINVGIPAKALINALESTRAKGTITEQFKSNPPNTAAEEGVQTHEQNHGSSFSTLSNNIVDHPSNRQGQTETSVSSVPAAVPETVLPPSPAASDATPASFAVESMPSGTSSNFIDLPVLLQAKSGTPGNASLGSPEPLGEWTTVTSRKNKYRS